MAKQTITPEEWLAAVAAVDDNPAVRALARKTLEEFRRLQRVESRAVDTLRYPPFGQDPRAIALRILGRATDQAVRA